MLSYGLHNSTAGFLFFHNLIIIEIVSVDAGALLEQMSNMWAFVGMVNGRFLLGVVLGRTG